MGETLISSRSPAYPRDITFKTKTSIQALTPSNRELIFSFGFVEDGHRIPRTSVACHGIPRKYCTATHGFHHAPRQSRDARLDLERSHGSSRDPTGSHRLPPSSQLGSRGNTQYFSTLKFLWYIYLPITRNGYTESVSSQKRVQTGVKSKTPPTRHGIVQKQIVPVVEENGAGTHTVCSLCMAYNRYMFYA